MEKMRFGRTDLEVSRSGFGAIPIMRISMEEAKNLLLTAYEGGINFYDTARGYTGSEEKIGYALEAVRKHVIIATKSGAKDRAGLFRDLEISLKNLRTDYIDILQLHNPQTLPDVDDPDGSYAGLGDAQRRGMVRYIGLTNHKLSVALQAAQSERYDTIQFPLSCLSSQDDLALIEECAQRDIGVIAMKALSGGLITNAVPTFAFLRQYAGVVPIWGIQRQQELRQFLELEAHPPQLDSALMKVIQNDREELAGDFCRGCGYCMPCPQEIPISMAARIAFMLRRAPYQGYLEEHWREQMERIEACTECGECKSKCPYELDVPNLLKKMLADYTAFYREHAST